MACPRSDQYRSSSRTSDDLEALGKEALADITASLQCNVQYGLATEDLSDIRRCLSTRTTDSTFLFLKNPRGAGRFIEGRTRFYVLNDDEWQANRKMTLGPNYMGSYVYVPAAVLLHKSSNPAFSWCRTALIHETLHSTSLYSRIFENPIGIIPNHKFLNEGITECLTGYVLLKRRPDCYATWKLSMLGQCGVAYKQQTKLFCSLAQIIGITPLAKFYLSLEKEFNSPWSKFLGAIHSAGFAKFNYSIDGQKAFRENLFRDECIKNIAGFKKIYESDARALDFSKIP